MKKIFFLILISVSTALYGIEQPLYRAYDVPAGPDYIVKDFCVYNYSNSYLQAFLRLSYAGPDWRQFVRVNLSFFKQGSLVGTDYSYADYETYGYSGMWPGSETFLAYYIDKVDFDSVAFMVTWNSSSGSEPKLNRYALVVSRTALQPWSGSTSKVMGLLKNQSGIALKYPKVFICVFKEKRLLMYDFTYADVPDNALPPLSEAMFETYVDLPVDYDSLAFVPCYSLVQTGDIKFSLVSGENGLTQPANCTLSQNYPNPFNSSTVISFELPESGPIKLSVHDISGRLVRVLAEGNYAAGKFQVTMHADGLPSGIYHYLLTAGGKRLSGKMTRIN